MSDPNPLIPADLAARWCWYGRGLRLIGTSTVIPQQSTPAQMFKIARAYEQAAAIVAARAEELRNKTKPGPKAQRPASAPEALTQSELDL